MSGSPSLDHLLAHAGWLARLARQLVRDGAVAEEVVQEAWLAARRSPPDPARPARPWLAQVLRNTIRMRSRAESRRERRERDAWAERDVASPPADEVLARMETHRLLVALVMELEEPLRTTVLLRFFEDRSSSEISNVMKVPAGTVRWRLKTALDRLRVALDARSGGQRRLWALALAPVDRPVADAAPAPTVILLGKTKAASGVAALAMVALVVGGVSLWRSRSAPPAGEAAPTELVPAPSAWSGWTLAVSAAAASGALAGRVGGSDGAPVPGASVLAVPAAWDPARHDRPALAGQASADAAGGFRIEGLPPGRYKVMASADGWAPGLVEGVDVAARGDTTLEIVLGAGGVVLSGEVSDAGGGPVPGAVVTAEVVVPLGGTTRSPFVLRARADQAGRFRLPSQAGRHRLVVEAPGYGPAERWLQVREPRTLAITLMPAQSVTGRVIERSSGLGVARAEVLLEPLEEVGRRAPAVAPAHTDEAGRFTFPAVGTGVYVLAARRGSLASGDTELVVAGAGPIAVDVLVDRAATASGRVVDGAGRGVADAVVQLRSGTGLRGRALETRSDASGAFRIPGVLPGRYTALAQPEGGGFAPFEGLGFVMGGADITNLVLPLTEPAFVEGLALEPDGTPAAGLEIGAQAEVRHPGREASSGTSVVTDDQGRFRLSLMSGRARIVAHDPGRGHAVEVLARLARGETHRVVLRLQPVGPAGQARISGEVRYHDGRPAADVAVRARGDRSHAQTRTDERGSFLLRGLAAEAVRLEALLDEDLGHSGTWNQSRLELALTAGEQRSGVVLTLPGPGRIAGRVLAADGRPAAGAAVAAAYEERGRPVLPSARRAVTDAAGLFVIDGLSDGLHTVWAMDGAHPEVASRAVRTGTHDLELRFAPAAALEGVVVDPDGAPVRSYALAIRLAGDQSRQRFRPRMQIADPEGAFRARRLSAGTYLVEALAGDGARVGAEVTLEAGEVRRGLRLVVQPGVTIEGAIRDAETGNPVGDADAWISFPGGSTRVAVDGRGLFQVPAVPRGGVTLDVGAPGYAAAHAKLELTPADGPVRRMDVRLSRPKDGREP